MLKLMKSLGNWYKKSKFQKLLAAIMVALFSILFLLFSTTVTYLSESKIRENVEDNMSIVVKQFDVYLGNYIASIYDGFRSLESNQDLIQLRSLAQEKKNLSLRAASYIYLNKLANQFLSANSTSVNNVYINFNNGRVTSQAYGHDLLKIHYSYDSWKKRFPENKYYWVDANYCRDLIPDPDIGVVLFRLYDQSEFSDSGIILVGLKKEFFNDILNVSAVNSEAGLSLITDYGMMHFGDADAGKEVERYQSAITARADHTKTIQSDLISGYYFMYKKLKLTDWKLVYTVKETSISNAHYIIRDVLFLTVIGMITASVLIAVLSKAVSRSLSELTKKIEAKDVLDHVISIDSYAEITSLSNGLEEMRIRINHLLKEVKTEQETKRQIEIALLQEQINPHFLYNTIYSIMQLCEMNRPKQASEMLKALSDFYRLGLNRGESIVTVEEELEHVKTYLFIQHFRYSDLFDYSIDCDSEILNCRIPKMSLQPLVENAIYHGIKQKREFGNICILGGTYDGKYAYLEVHDDGIGFTESQLVEIQKQLETDTRNGKYSFGLKNVDSRIKFEFGSDFGLQIESIPNDTCVRIHFAMKQL